MGSSDEANFSFNDDIETTSLLWLKKLFPLFRKEVRIYHCLQALSIFLGLSMKFFLSA
jgi:hypothetical protein